MGAPFIAPESLFLGITLFASDVGLLTAGTDLPKDTDVKSYLTSAGATGVTLIYFDLGSSALVLLPFDSLSFSVSNVVTPEPGSMLLIGAGLAGIAGLRRKRRKVAA